MRKRASFVVTAAVALTVVFIVGKFGRAGKLLKEFGTVNAIDCRTENELYVGELGNWRVQKVTLKAGAAGTR